MSVQFTGPYTYSGRRVWGVTGHHNLAIHERGKRANRYDVIDSRFAGGAGATTRELLAVDLPLRDAKRLIREMLAGAV